MPAQPFGRGSEPDWEALADANEAQGRRRKLLRIGGGALGVVVVCGLVVTAFAWKPWSTPNKEAAQPTASASSTAKDGAAPSQSASASPVVLAPNTGKSTIELTGAAVTPGHGWGSPRAVQAWGRVVDLAGRPGSYGRAADQVVDVTKSFTVSAWVYNTATAENRSAISQGDQSDYSFDLGLQHWGGHNNWVFKVQTAAGGQNQTVAEVFSKQAAAINQWVLLTGTYDAQKHTMSFFVNGQPAGSNKFKGIWNAPGRTEIGRLRNLSNWGDRWQGQLSQIQIWDRALTPAQAAGLAKSPTGAGVQPTASWLVG